MKKYLLSLLLISANVNAGMTVADYQKNVNSEAINMYVAGVANGFAFSNTELQSLNKPQLFCQPSNLLLKVPDYKKLLESAFIEFKKEKLPSLQIEPILLRKLMQTYPCK